jgi:phosphatidylglycerophosphatase A
MSTQNAGQFATLFGIGRSPYAPGTVASMVALPFAWIVSLIFGPFILFALSVLAGGIGIWACDAYAKESGKHDPSECVIDELAGQWLACALAPLSIGGFVLAFLLFRLFDIVKFWPMSEAEKLDGGLGIVADDMVAGLLAGILVALVHNVGLV